jgi:very-short-patch-repair endonuclease
MATSDSARGVHALKAYLHYAETRELAPVTRVYGESDSAFEDSVYEFLRHNEYEVRKQVGCAKFRIDLAIVDPDQPGRYLMGIECDGAQYHSSRVARERDRLRQSILEGLGWRLYRVWSTDWYRNRTQAMDRLIRAVNGARMSPQRTSPRVESLTDN